MLVLRLSSIVKLKEITDVLSNVLTILLCVSFVAFIVADLFIFFAIFLIRHDSHTGFEAVGRINMLTYNLYSWCALGRHIKLSFFGQRLSNIDLYFRLRLHYYQS